MYLYNLAALKAEKEDCLKFILEGTAQSDLLIVQWLKKWMAAISCIPKISKKFFTFFRFDFNIRCCCWRNNGRLV